MCIRNIKLYAIAVLLFSITAEATQYNAPEVSRSGIIDSIDLSSNELVVEGHRYSVSQTVQVEIAGSYGAFTMLSRGMRITFRYHRYDDGSREIFAITRYASTAGR